MAKIEKNKETRIQNRRAKAICKETFLSGSTLGWKPPLGWLINSSILLLQHDHTMR